MFTVEIAPDYSFVTPIQSFDGVSWVDVTDYVRHDGIAISTGRQDENSDADATSLSLVFDNRQGHFSTTNPLGQWYGRLGLNTPIRVTHTGESAYVFEGFIQELPVRWDKSGKDSTAPIVASGTLRRIGQRSKPLDSPLHRSYLLENPIRPLAYWTCEDEMPRGGAEFSSAIGSRPLRFRPNGVEPSTFSDFVASKALPMLGPSTIPVVGSFRAGGTVPAAATTGFIGAAALVHWDENPTGTRILFGLHTSGTVGQWRVLRFASGDIGLRTVDAEGETISSPTGLFNRDFANENLWVSLSISGTTNPAWVLRVAGIENGHIVRRQANGVVSGYTVQRATRAGVGSTLAGPGIHVGHLVVSNDVRFFEGFPSGTGSGRLTSPLNAYTGELAGQRIERICREEQIPFKALGDLDKTIPMGPQPIATALEVIRDAEHTDLGVVYDEREGLAFAPRASRYNQPVSLTLDVTAGELADAPEPTNDDQRTVNEVSASSPLGHTASLVDEAHTRRVGRYNEEISANTAFSHSLRGIASWLLHLGTSQDLRWPRIPVNLRRNPHLISQWLNMPHGGRLRIPHELAQIAGVDVDLLVEGADERLTHDEWDVELNTSPAAPWEVWQLEHGVRGRVHSVGSSLADPIAAGATTLSVRNSGRPWITSAAFPSQFPFDIDVGGEVMRVTACSTVGAPSILSPFQENFNTANGPLNTASTQLTWSVINGKPSPSGVWSVVSNQASPGGGSRGAVNYARAEHSTITTNQYAQIQINQLLSGAENQVGPCVRFQDNGATCYMAMIRRQISDLPGNPPGITIRRSIDGLRTDLTAPVAVALSLPATLRVEVVGNQIRALWNGSLVAEVTDTAIQAGTKTGIYGHEHSGNSLGVLIDNFESRGLGGDGLRSSMTVIRGINGVNKDHDAGTKVQLASRHVLAL